MQRTAQCKCKSLSSKNGDREHQREEKKENNQSSRTASQLEDLTLARFNHNMNNLKWRTEYPAVLKQLLLKINSMEFLQFYTSTAGNHSLQFSQYRVYLYTG